MKKTVLLIDDSITIHKIIDMTINHDLFTVINCITEREGFLYVEGKDIDAVMLDNKLMGPNIEIFIKKVRTEVPTAKIIILAGAYDRFTKNDMEKLNADAFIIKPFDSLTLNNILISTLTVDYSKSDGGIDFKTIADGESLPAKAEQTLEPATVSKDAWMEKTRDAYEQSINNDEAEEIDDEYAVDHESIETDLTPENFIGESNTDISENFIPVVNKGLELSSNQPIIESPAPVHSAPLQIETFSTDYISEPAVEDLPVQEHSPVQEYTTNPLLESTPMVDLSYNQPEVTSQADLPVIEHHGAGQYGEMDLNSLFSTPPQGDIGLGATEHSDTSFDIPLFSEDIFASPSAPLEDDMVQDPAMTTDPVGYEAGLNLDGGASTYEHLSETVTTVENQPEQEPADFEQMADSVEISEVIESVQHLDMDKVTDILTDEVSPHEAVTVDPQQAYQSYNTELTEAFTATKDDATYGETNLDNGATISNADYSAVGQSIGDAEPIEKDEDLVARTEMLIDSMIDSTPLEIYAVDERKQEYDEAYDLETEHVDTDFAVQTNNPEEDMVTKFFASDSCPINGEIRTEAVETDMPLLQHIEKQDAIEGLLLNTPYDLGGKIPTDADLVVEPGALGSDEIVNGGYKTVAPADEADFRKDIININEQSHHHTPDDGGEQNALRDLFEEVYPDVASTEGSHSTVYESGLPDSAQLLQGMVIDRELIKSILRELLAPHIEDIVNKVIPALAAEMIKEEIDKIKKGE